MGRKAKRKTENKIKKHEIEFVAKTIDMIRFAYDVFRYSALKIGVPENCIVSWNGPANDYVPPDFISTVSTLIIVYQISFRDLCNKYFNEYFPSNGDLSLELMCFLLQGLIKMATSCEGLDVFKRVELSLCVVCELILYLYSRGSSLYLRELAKYWFDCYFHLEKQAFGKNGLAVLYSDGFEEKNKLPDQSFDEFINFRCRNYKESAKDANLRKKYLKSIEIYKESHPEEVSNQCKSALFVRLPEPLTSHQDEASGIDFPPNLGLPDDATPCQNLPGASSEERPWHSKRLSAQGTRGNRNYSSRPGFEQDTRQLSLDFSEMRLSSERNASVSGAKDATPNYNLLGAKPKEPIKDCTQASGSQTSESSIDSSRKEKSQSQSKKSRKKKSNVSVGEDATPSHNLLETRLQIPVEYTQGPTGVQTSTSGSMEEQRLGQSGLDSTAKKQLKKKNSNVSVAKDATPSYDLPRVRPKISAEHSRENSGLLTGISSLRSSVEQQLRQFSLDSSEKKESSEEKPTVSVAVDVAPSDELEAGLKIPTEYTQRSSGLLTGPSRRALLQKSYKKLNLDSLRKLQSNEKKPSVSVNEDATPSHNLLVEKPEEPARYSTGSSGLPSSESSLYSSMEQGLRQLSLDSSGSEKVKKRAIKSANDPAPSYSLPPVSQDPAKELRGSSSEEEKQEKDIHEEK